MNKNVLIIGASGDIGKAIAIELGKEGYQLMLHYNQNHEAINEIRHLVSNEQILAEFKADLANISEVKRMLNEIVFPVDQIIFASGNAYFGLFQNTTENIMDRMLTIHIKSPWLITNHFLTEMVRRKYGKIIFITSIWGEIGASNEVIYSSVKGAQNSFVKALAKEIGPSGISVNAVSPGFIDTKMNDYLNEEEKMRIISEIPLNRAGTPYEIAHTISFLLADKAKYIHGEIIRVGGGW